MISTRFRFMLKNAMSAAAMLWLLAACSPDYDWRELDVADGRVRAAFPAKVRTEARDLSLAGTPLRFSLAAAEAHHAVYAVGYAALPPEVAGDPAASRAIAAALMQSLYANLGADSPDPVPTYGQDIEVHGEAAHAGGRSWLLARVWVRNGMLIEAVAAGAEGKLPPERAREFMDAVRVHP